MVYETIPVTIRGEETNARLYTYFWSNSKELYDGRRRPCVLICPGGAYAMTSDREAEGLAVRFLEMGYHATVLRYSTAPDCPRFGSPASTLAGHFVSKALRRWKML